MYQVHIQGTPNQKLFLNKIGSVGERGKNTPQFLSNLEQIQANPNHDVIPKEAWKLIVNEAKNQKGISWREVSKALNTSYCGSSLFKSGISRERMRTLFQFFKDDNLKRHTESDIYWDEIVSITELGIEDVYDATVPGVHNFVANDMIVHNSIENDADIIMMLFRRDYYDKYDKPGTADLIIAKNRHGPVGDISLTFRKEIGQFANFTPMQAQPEIAKANKEAFSAFSPEE
jgi:replicative DNA helicase